MACHIVEQYNLLMGLPHFMNEIEEYQYRQRHYHTNHNDNDKSYTITAPTASAISAAVYTICRIWLWRFLHCTFHFSTQYFCFFYIFVFSNTSIH
jgi:hypothetical protein